MNDRFELGKVKRSTVGNGGISIWPVRPAGVIALHRPRIGCELFPARNLSRDRTEDFGGRETAYDHALNV